VVQDPAAAEDADLDADRSREIAERLPRTRRSSAMMRTITPRSRARTTAMASWAEVKSKIAISMEAVAPSTCSTRAARAP
jgi:hypothetical protein